MTKYIFLDIDGVLNSEHTWDEDCRKNGREIDPIVFLAHIF